MRIKSVQIEGMHKVIDETYELSNATYFVGPNGSGKSTILQAIILGLLGYIPGTAKKTGDIFNHANGNRMCVTLTLCDDNQTIVLIREFIKSGGKVETSLEISPSNYDISTIVNDISLPMLNFNEFLGLSANKQKELLISLLPNNVEAINTKDYLSGDSSYTVELSDFVSELVEDYTQLQSISDIKQFNEYLKEVQSTLTAEEKRVTATTQSLIFYDDYNGEEDVEVLQSQISSLLEKRDKALQVEAKAAAYETQKAQLEELDRQLSLSLETDSNYLQFKEILANCEEESKANAIEQKELIQEIEKIKYELQQNQKIIDSNGICPFIEDNCSQIWDSIPKLKEDSQSLQVKLQTLNDELEQITQRASELSNQYNKTQITISELEKQYDRRSNLRNIVANSIELLDYTSDELSIELQRLNDDLVKSSANAKYKELVEVVETQKLKLLPQIEFIKSAVKRTGANGLQSEVAKRPFKDMELAMYLVQKQLGFEDLGTPEFNLEEKANSFTFGFMRSKFIPFELLSSGEKCIFTLMFMVALCECSNAELKCVLIDDLLDHLDDERFKTIINSVSYGIESLQFVFAGVKPTQQQSLQVVDLGK